jgi:hypothetical protein
VFSDHVVGRTSEKHCLDCEEPQSAGETIVARLTERVLPQALRIFEKGGSVPFGPLSISPPDLLTYKDKRVAWGQVARLDVEFSPQMKSTQLEVRTSGRFLTWCSMPPLCQAGASTLVTMKQSFSVSLCLCG